MQDRDRDILPAPHVTLQEPQLPQFDQPPCTAIKMLILVHKIKKKDGFFMVDAILSKQQIIKLVLGHGPRLHVCDW